MKGEHWSRRTALYKIRKRKVRLHSESIIGHREVRAAAISKHLLEKRKKGGMTGIVHSIL